MRKARTSAAAAPAAPTKKGLEIEYSSNRCPAASGASTRPRPPTTWLPPNTDPWECSSVAREISAASEGKTRPVAAAHIGTRNQSCPS